MSEKEQGEILQAFLNLPEDKKQFVAGYAAGLADRAVTAEPEKPEEKKDEKTA